MDEQSDFHFPALLLTIPDLANLGVGRALLEGLFVTAHGVIYEEVEEVGQPSFQLPFGIQLDIVIVRRQITYIGYRLISQEVKSINHLVQRNAVSKTTLRY